MHEHKSELRPPPEGIAPDVKAVRERIADARKLEWQGRTEESLTLARKACTSAEQLGYGPVRAEALVQIARALDGRQTADARVEAERLYFEALEIARIESYAQLAAEVWGRLVMLAIRMDSWLRPASSRCEEHAAVIATTDCGCDQMKSSFIRGEIHYRNGKYDEAERSAEEAIVAVLGVSAEKYQPSLLSALTSYQKVELSRYYGALAKSLEPQGRFEDAIKNHHIALKIATTTLAASHPDFVQLRMNYGLALRKQGQLELAARELEDVEKIMRRAGRDSSLDAGILQTFLSDLAYEEGQLAQALEHGHNAKEIYERIGAPPHRLAEACTNIANGELKGRNFVAALAMYTEALELRRPRLGSDHYQVGVNEGSLAETLIGLSRYDEAIAHAEKARCILERSNQASKDWIDTVYRQALAGQQKKRKYHAGQFIKWMLPISVFMWVIWNTLRRVL